MATKIVSPNSTPRSGAGSCATNSLQTPIGYVIYPPNTALNVDDSADLIGYIGNSVASTIKGKFVTYEGQNEDDVIQEGSVGLRGRARDGKPRDLYTIASTVTAMNELAKLNSGCANYSIFRILADGKLQGHTYDPVAKTLYGFTPSMISVATVTSGSDEAKASKAIQIDYAKPTEMNEDMAVVDPNYDILTIDGITVTYLTLDGSDVRVNFNSGEFDVASEGAAVSGLEDAFETTDGTPVAGITEVATNLGTYTGFTASTDVQLIAPEDQTEDLRYYGENSVSIPA